MAYRTIENAEVSVDAPIDNALITAIRDNCIAIAQGLSGAPKIARIARDDSNTSEFIKTQFFTAQGGQIEHKASEENIIHSIQIDNGNVFTLSGGDATPNIDSQDYIFRRAGKYTLKLQAVGRSSIESVGGKVYVNGNLVFTGATTTTIRFDFLDVTVAAGDTLKLNLHGSSTGQWFFGRVHLTVYSANSFAETCGIGQYTKYINGVTHTSDATKYGEF
mgnify:CR=1 FL=1